MGGTYENAAPRCSRLMSTRYGATGCLFPAAPPPPEPAATHFPRPASGSHRPPAPAPPPAPSPRPTTPRIHALAMDPLYQRLGRDAGNRLLAGRVDIQHLHRRRIVEGVHKFLHQIARSRVAVRLEDHMHPAVPAFLRRPQRRANLRRMVPVIVHHRHPAHAALHLEAPVDSAKRLQSSSRSPPA